MKRWKFIFILIIVVFIGCNRQTTKDQNPEARELFLQSADLIHSYTRKIKSAQSIPNIDSLYQLFEKSITEINFTFPPETDLKLTIEENDSLYSLLVKLKRVRDERLKELNILSIPDSINIQK